MYTICMETDSFRITIGSVDISFTAYTGNDSFRVVRPASRRLIVLKNGWFRVARPIRLLVLGNGRFWIARPVCRRSLVPGLTCLDDRLCVDFVDLWYLMSCGIILDLEWCFNSAGDVPGPVFTR